MSELDQYKYLDNPKLDPKKNKNIYQTSPHLTKGLNATLKKNTQLKTRQMRKLGEEKLTERKK